MNELMWGSVEFFEMVFAWINGIETYVMIIGVLVVLPLLFSACWAADIVEHQGGRDSLAFVGGFFAPFIVPILLKKHYEEEAEALRAIEVPDIVHETQRKSENLAQFERETDEVEEVSIYDSEYFSRFPVDENGVRFGEFSLDTINGDHFSCSAIRKVYSDRAVFVYEVNGQERSIRLKFSNIEKFIDNSKREN